MEEESRPRVGLKKEDPQNQVRWRMGIRDNATKIYVNSATSVYGINPD